MKPDRLVKAIQKHPKRVVLYKLTYGELDGSEECLGEWERPAPEDAIETVHAMLDAAQGHCDEMTASCKYRVLGYDEGADRPVVTAMLRCSPEGAVPMEGLRNLEDASAAGVTAQAIRHTEVMVQILARMMGQILSVQGQQIEQLQKTVEIHQRRESDVSALAHAVMQQGADTVHAEKTAERWDRLIGVVGEYAPQVLRELELLPPDAQENVKSAALAAASAGAQSNGAAAVKAEAK